jgi:hypothetical protein
MKTIQTKRAGDGFDGIIPNPKLKLMAGVKLFL